jgi:hypothetical protein
MAADGSSWSTNCKHRKSKNTARANGTEYLRLGSDPKDEYCGKQTSSGDRKATLNVSLFDIDIVMAGCRV